MYTQLALPFATDTPIKIRARRRSRQRLSNAPQKPYHYLPVFAATMPQSTYKVDPLQHTKLVYKAAHELAHKIGESFEDCVQEGYLGLLKACRDFDPSKGFAFSSYAMPQIRGRIMKMGRNQKLLHFTGALRDNPAMQPRVASLSTKIRVAGTQKEYELIDVLPDVRSLSPTPDPTPEQLALQRAMARLDPSDRAIIERYYVWGQDCAQQARSSGQSARAANAALKRARARLKLLIVVDAVGDEAIALQYAKPHGTICLSALATYPRTR